MLPTRCDMPDIQTLKQLGPQFMLSAYFSGLEAHLSKKFNLYRKSLIRLIDKAIWEYKAARVLLLKQIIEMEACKSGARVIYIIQMSNHLENSINATHRAWKMVKCLLDLPYETPLPAELTNFKSPSIGAFRGRIEHIDEDIQKDKIDDGDSIGIVIESEGTCFRIANRTMSFEDFARQLCDLHKVAEALCQFRIQPGS